MEIRMYIKYEQLKKKYNEIELENDTIKRDKIIMNKMDEIIELMKRINEIRIKDKKYNYNEENDELEYIFDVRSNFSNPLNTITDLNRSYSNFKIILNMNG